MNPQRECNDNNPKVVKRVFSFDNKSTDSANLCKNCKQNPVFSNFIAERLIQ